MFQVWPHSQLPRPSGLHSVVLTELSAFIIITGWKNWTQECCDEGFSVLLDCSHSFFLQAQNKVSHLKPIENLSASIFSIWLVLRKNSKQSVLRQNISNFGINSFLLKSEIFRKNNLRWTLAGLPVTWSERWWWDSWCEGYDGVGWSVTPVSQALRRDGDGLCADNRHNNQLTP